METYTARELRTQQKKVLSAVRQGHIPQVTFHGEPFMRCVPEGRFQELERAWQIVSGLRGLATLLERESGAALSDLDAALGRLRIALPADCADSVAA